MGGVVEAIGLVEVGLWVFEEVVLRWRVRLIGGPWS